MEAVTTWFLPPAPEVVNFTNTTITANVVLDERHEDIVEIYLMVSYDRLTAARDTTKIVQL